MAASDDTLDKLLRRVKVRKLSCRLSSRLEEQIWARDEAWIRSVLDCSRDVAALPMRSHWPYAADAIDQIRCAEYLLCRIIHMHEETNSIAPSKLLYDLSLVLCDLGLEEEAMAPGAP
jgi:hypothetical protein